MLKILNNSVIYLCLAPLLFLLLIIFPNDSLIYFFRLILITLISITLHELGHFLVGRCLSYKLEMLATPFFFYFRKKIYFKFPVLLAFGYCQMSNRNITNEKNSDRNLVFYFFGGGGANLIVAILALLGFVPYASEFFILNIILFLVPVCLPIDGTDGNAIREIVLYSKDSKTYQRFFANSLYNNPYITIDDFAKLTSKEKSFFSKFEKCLINLYFEVKGEGSAFTIANNEVFDSNIQENIIREYYKLLHKSSDWFIPQNLSSEEVVFTLSNYIYSKNNKYLKKIKYLKKLVDFRQEEIIDFILNKEGVL